MSDFSKYILTKTGKVWKVKNIKRWDKWMMRGENRFIKQTTLKNGYFVSTVFLGLNYGPSEEKPILFETMVFDKWRGGDSIYQERYESLDRAYKGHRNIVGEYKEKLYLKRLFTKLIFNVKENFIEKFTEWYKKNGGYGGC